MSEAYITGVGIVDALGIDHQQRIQSMYEGKSGISFSSDKPDAFPQVAGYVQNFVPKEHIPRKLIRSMNEQTLFAYVAADKAIEEAGLDGGLQVSEDDTERGIIMGAGISQGISSMIDGVVPCIDEEGTMDYEKFGIEGYRKFAPTWILQRLPNTTAGQISIKHSLQGLNYSVVNGGNSSFVAIGQAYAAIANDRAKQVVCGGTEWEPILEFIHGLKERGVASYDPEHGATPFSPESTGSIVGTGSAALNMESKESALSRDVEIYGRVGAFTNLYHPYFDQADTEDIASLYERSMRKTIESAGLSISDIGFIQASAIGASKIDEAEALAIKNIFSGNTPVTCISSSIGYTLAASGSLSLAYALLQLKQNSIMPIARLKDAFYSKEVDYVRETPRALKKKVCLVNSFDFQGSVCSMLIQND